MKSMNFNARTGRNAIRKRLKKIGVHVSREEVLAATTAFVKDGGLVSTLPSETVVPHRRVGARHAVYEDMSNMESPIHAGI